LCAESGKFTKSQDDVSRSLASDRRQHAKRKVKSGEGDRVTDKSFDQPRVKNVKLIEDTKTQAEAPAYALRLGAGDRSPDRDRARGVLSEIMPCTILDVERIRWFGFGEVLSDDICSSLVR